jgi:hypothetical protein
MPLVKCGVFLKALSSSAYTYRAEVVERAELQRSATPMELIRLPMAGCFLRIVAPGITGVRIQRAVALAQSAAVRDSSDHRIAAARPAV